MTRRTPEERIAEIDEKILKKEKELESLKQQKERILHPVSMKSVFAKAKETGMTAEEIAKKLGLEM